MRLLAGCLAALLTTACAHEQKRAAQVLQCPEEQVADVTRLPPETEVATGEVAGKVVLLVIGHVLAAMAGLRGGGSGAGLGGPPAPPPVWPHVWSGCRRVAVCDENGACRAAYWLEPSHLPTLMEKSKQGDFLEHYGIGECPETPREVQMTSAVTWDLRVCRQTIKCWAVVADQQFQCGWSVHAPKGAAPSP